MEKILCWGRALRRDKGMALSLLYIFLPVFLFFAGWLRLALAVPLCLLLLWLFMRVSKKLCTGAGRVGVRYEPEYWITLCAVVFIWLLFSGIGGFSYQNSDYFVRNPIYRDLVAQPWPVFYDLSSQRMSVQAVIGSEPVAFVYYFCFWLPPALLSKIAGISGAGELASDVFLFLWAYLGVMLVLYQIHRYLKRCSWAIPGIFIFFGGYDALGYRILRGDFELGAHLEWWCTYFQYSSDTTLLYWVFNQAIPAWLIVMVFLNMREDVSMVGVCALIFAYSPFATFGMIPLAAYAVLRHRREWKKALTWENILLPFSMLLVFGSFYLSNPGSMPVKGWIFRYHPAGELVWHHLLFFVLEVGIYLPFLKAHLRKYDYLWLALIELALIPLYKMTPANDFAMRASIPGLLILAVSLMRHALECRKKWARWALILVVSVGAVTPISEICRSMTNTALQGARPVETVHSFQDFATDDKGILQTCSRQFFAYGYEESFFFRYMGKRK